MSTGHSSLILCYHSISVGRSPLKIPPAIFAAQIEWLGANARVLPLGDLVECLAGGESLPERSVALTFDDAFADFYAHAGPTLKRLQLPATVFVPTAFCARTNRWPGQPAWVEEQPLMTWDQIGELARDGISFGSHSVSHPDLTALSPAELEREVLESKREIEARIGRPSEFFCYPYGRWNSAAREAVRRFYRGACSTSARLLSAGSDPYSLPRVDAHYIGRPGLFRLLFTARFRAYLAARRWSRRLRGQPEGY